MIKNPANLLKDIEALKGESLKLPLPRRVELPAVDEYRRMLLGDGQKLIEFCAKNEFTAAHFISAARADAGIAKLMSQIGGREPLLRTMYLMGRHGYNKAPIYTVSEGLNDLLDDTDVKDNIPIRFFAPPRKVCYVEFNESSTRERCSLRTFGGGNGAILEGCYIQESNFDKLPSMDPRIKELLELDPQSPTRIIDIGFTASPLGLSDDMAGSVLQDTIDTISLHIQDENEPFSEVLRRHQQFNLDEAILKYNGNEGLYQILEQNLSRLTKILFYLSVEREDRKEVREYSELAERLKGVGQKKKPKLERMMSRVYDRIIVGPKHYTPIKQKIAEQNLPSGTRAPHYRSGYFGIRWIGTGQAKVPQLRRVKETVVNAHLLKNGEGLQSRDYEIR